jgi:hypothetical protein
MRDDCGNFCGAEAGARPALYQIGAAPTVWMPKYLRSTCDRTNTRMPQSIDDAIGRQHEAGAVLPRSEPEIIPPGADFRPRSGTETGFDTRRGIHIRVPRLGPLGIATIFVGVGIVGALSVLLLAGALLIGAAAAGMLMAITLVARLLARFRA